MKYCLPAFIILFLFCSCGPFLNQPVGPERARTGETSQVSKNLKNLPLPQEPVVVGVYNFKDQTGQYKNIENGSSFSTAVTQGATSVLVKALEDSKWFTPIERENLSNLLNERNIIRSTRQEYINNNNSSQTQLPPLLYAGVLLEGGVVSYDSNIITGGVGARYFGVGGATQYRQDRITVYLRAISTSSGKILKTVYISKTILSQAVDANLFRYVNFQRLLEVETGYTHNEPVQLAVKEAVEKAVEALIIEGIEGNLWKALNPKEGEELVAAYKAEKEEEELTRLYNRKTVQREHGNSFNFSTGLNTLSGDYKNRDAGYFLRGEYKKVLSSHFDFSLSGSYMEFNTGNNINSKFISADLNFTYNLLPNDELGPFIYGGPGLIANIGSEGSDTSIMKLQYGGGLKLQLSSRWDLKIFAEHHWAFSDELDRLINGKRDDFFFNFGIGFEYNFGSKTGNSAQIKEETETTN